MCFDLTASLKTKFKCVWNGFNLLDPVENVFKDTYTVGKIDFNWTDWLNALQVVTKCMKWAIKQY